MIMIQFREEDHARNMHLLRTIKKNLHELCDNLEKSEEEAHGERRYIIDQFDERPRHHEMDERRGGGRGGMMGRRDNRSMDREYPEYPIDERGGGGRYSY